MRILRKVLIVGFIGALFIFPNKVQSQTEQYDFKRIEIYDSPFHTLRIVREGMICSLSDTKGNKETKFYPMETLDNRILCYIFKLVNENNLIEHDSIIEDKNRRISGSHLSFLIIDDNFKMNYISWRSGKDPVLNKLIKKINMLIPKEDRHLFEFTNYSYQ